MKVRFLADALFYSYTLVFEIEKEAIRTDTRPKWAIMLSSKTVYPKDFKHFYRLLTDTHTEYMGTWVKCTFRCACGTGEQCQPTQHPAEDCAAALTEC